MNQIVNKWHFGAWSASIAVGMSGKGLVKKLIGSSKLLVEYKTIAGTTQVLTFGTLGLEKELQELPECRLN